ncbi:dihydrofolate reductase [Candidatus Nomurabacteria bacterium]|nr:dihydrofolate reductase [Candidatus Nomurabacteria bacterium]
MTEKPVRLDICIIAAMTPSGVIGRSGTLPWRMPSDLQRFRHLTLGHSVVMGYKTFAEIIARRGAPLTERINYVVTNHHVDQVRQSGATPLRTLYGGVADTWLNAKEYYIIGGRSLYEEALSRADRMLLTIIEADVVGDVYFPTIDYSQWHLVRETEITRFDPRDEHPSRFKEYERIKR